MGAVGSRPTDRVDPGSSIIGGDAHVGIVAGARFMSSRLRTSTVAASFFSASTASIRPTVSADSAAVRHRRSADDRVRGAHTA